MFTSPQVNADDTVRHRTNLRVMSYPSVNKMLPFLLFVLILIFHQVGVCCCERVASGKIGSQVTLKCDSSRNTELFMFWETPLGVIAPGYNSSRSKYKYDVLTGDLKIFIHQKEEKGKYSCYSRNLGSGVITVSTVALNVEEQWQMAGSDFLAVLYRCIAIVSVSIVVLGGWIAHIFWTKFLQKSYILDDIDQLESMDGDVELTQLNP